MLCAPAQEKIGDSIDNLKTDELGADLKNVTSSFAAVQDSLRAIQSDVLTDLGKTTDADTFRTISDQFVAYQNPLPSVNNTAGMAKMNEYIGTVEDHRYWWSIGLFSLFALLSIMSMFGVCFKSKVLDRRVKCIGVYVSNLGNVDWDDLRFLFHPCPVRLVPFSPAFRRSRIVRLLPKPSGSAGKFHPNAR